MPTELKVDLPLQIRHNAAGKRATNGVRLNPLPAKNTLLTIIFFSALAAAILYWVFFPPAAPKAPETSPTPDAQTAEQH